MADDALETALQTARRTQMIIWLALTAEPFTYVILVLVWVSTQAESAQQDTTPYMKWGLYLLAVILACASLLIRRFLLSDRQIQARLAMERAEAEGSPGSGTLSVRESEQVSLSHWYLTSMLLSWGLNSCIPIGGLVLLFAGGDGTPLLVLSAATVVLNLLAYPQVDAFVERARDLSVN